MNERRAHAPDLGCGAASASSGATTEARTAQSCRWSGFQLAAHTAHNEAIRCGSTIRGASKGLRCEQGRSCNLTKPSRQIRFRAGVNVGDVITEGRDLLGSGVNVAARLEALAEPGGRHCQLDVITYDL